MDWHRIRLTLATPTPTPFQADTIFGHLCWALAHTEGPDFLEVFLYLYGDGEPPLLLSNGFPGDLLPKPRLLARRPQTTDRARLRQDFRENKQAKKAEWLSPDEFEAARRGEVIVPSLHSGFKQQVTMRTAINRSTGTAAEGTLFPTEELFPAGEHGGRVTIYALVAPDFVACLRRCLSYLVASGWGKRKSVGYGAIASATLEPFAGFSAVEGANGFISLSNFVPAAGDPTRGAWNTLVKRGKLGEELAAGGHPFKRPLIMLSAGSCFYDWPLRPYYGRLVEGVHPAHTQVVQYGLALPVSARLPEGE